MAATLVSSLLGQDPSALEIEKAIRALFDLCQKAPSAGLEMPHFGSRGPSILMSSGWGKVWQALLLAAIKRLVISIILAKDFLSAMMNNPSVLKVQELLFSVREREKLLPASSLPDPLLAAASRSRPTSHRCRIPPSLLRANRRVSDFPQGVGGSLAGGARNWSRAIDSVNGDNREDDEGEDGSNEDRSLDLLVRFVQNVFRRISQRARKVVRSVLPVTISTQLFSFQACILDRADQNRLQRLSMLQLQPDPSSCASHMRLMYPGII